MFCTIDVAYLYLSPRIKGKRNCLSPIDDCCPRLLDHWVILQHIVSRGLEANGWSSILSYIGRPHLTLPHLVLASGNAPQHWVLFEFLCCTGISCLVLRFLLFRLSEHREVCPVHRIEYAWQLGCVAGFGIPCNPRTS